MDINVENDVIIINSDDDGIPSSTKEQLRLMKKSIKRIFSDKKVLTMKCEKLNVNKCVKSMLKCYSLFLFQYKRLMYPIQDRNFSTKGLQGIYGKLDDYESLDEYVEDINGLVDSYKRAFHSKSQCVMMSFFFFL